jgi:SagB-type dehydrogenase family enzyme
MVDAREYHEQTKHSPRSVRTDSHRLDPRTKPRPYKLYEDLPRVDPDGEVAGPSTPALAAVATSTPDPRGDSADEEPSEARDGDEGEETGVPVHALCHYATGVTKVRRRQGRDVAFRAAACTGKLYHVDLYAVTGACGPEGPGVYHFDPHDDGFDVVRRGDYRGVLAAAAGEGDRGVSTAPTPGISDAPVSDVANATWWRNAWKYRDRAFRHAFWDSGTILANLLATAHGLGHRAAVVGAFADDPVVAVLGVDPDAEAPLELVPVGSGDPPQDDPAAATVDPIDPETVPPSPETVDYPVVADAWRQGTLADGDAARAWRERPGSASEADLGLTGPGDGAVVDIEPVDAATASSRPVGTTIERRGSLREYDRAPLSTRTFATVLDRALRGVPGDWTGPGETRPPGAFVDCYCLVHAVEGIEPGAYQYHPTVDRLERLGDTDRETAAHLALDQDVVGDAAVNVYLLADVDRVVSQVGNRGHRLAQLEAGLALGRLYLATYAHRDLGGRGFTFYDDLVTDHLSPRAADQTPMTLFAFGHPRRD